jgi:pimeloyl-ACP methyl ester carboxylesterase
MSSLPDVVYLSTSYHLRRFDLPLLRHLSQYVTTAQWEYKQDLDEPDSMDIAVVLLHDYLKNRDQPTHLIGHGVGGLLGLLYARRYPERVKSLTLLSVGVYPAITWQSQYYCHRQFFPCDRHTLMMQMACHLFGHRDRETLKWLAMLLEKDIDCSLSPHSLFEQISIPAAGSPVPMLVCGCEDDFVVGTPNFQKWKLWFNDSDRLSIFPQGRHFFHYFHAPKVGREILQFWKSLQYKKATQSVLESKLQESKLQEFKQKL